MNKRFCVEVEERLKKVNVRSNDLFHFGGQSLSSLSVEEEEENAPSQHEVEVAVKKTQDARVELCEKMKIKQKVLKFANQVDKAKKIVEIGPYPITSLQFKRLVPGEWLDDDIISAFGRLLMADYDQQPQTNNKIKIKVMNTYFASHLFGRTNCVVYGYPVVKYYQNKDYNESYWFDKDIILVPINIGDTHWTLVCVFIKKKEIYYIDSMLSKGQTYLRCILSYLYESHLDLLNEELEVETWKLFSYSPNNEKNKESYYQKNGYDCGVYVCIAMEYIIKGWPIDFITSDIVVKYRDFISLSLVAQKMGDCCFEGEASMMDLTDDGTGDGPASDKSREGPVTDGPAGDGSGDKSPGDADKSGDVPDGDGGSAYKSGDEGNQEQMDVDSDDEYLNVYEGNCDLIE